MKYIPLQDFENVTSALNFDTADCHVLGGCDLYTTKAAGEDKKLEKDIHKSLNSDFEEVKKTAERLATNNPELFGLDLHRSSCFGPLGEVSNRRTFAYLIATLNSSHPDYDFSSVLKPPDFRRLRSLKHVMTTIDEVLSNLRPRRISALVARSASGIPTTPGGSQAWGPRMWKAIDKEMTLYDCDIYTFASDQDPFDGEDSAIWSHHFFFFNKLRKRVCYIYIRGLSRLTHRNLSSFNVSHSKRSRPVSSNFSVSDTGASKRARFWFGDMADVQIDGGWEDVNEADKEETTVDGPGDDEVDAEDALDRSTNGSAEVVTGSESRDDDDDDEIEQRYRSKHAVTTANEMTLQLTSS